MNKTKKVYISFIKDVVYMLGILTLIFKSMTMFTGSYSNNAFPDPLSKEEEEKQIELLFQKDINARNKLIEHNLRLVSHIAKKYNSKYDNDDLISIGIIGLIKGIDSYSKEKGTKLTTYAAKCIENEILMHFRNEKKNMNNIYLEEKIDLDKDGNEIELIDILKTEKNNYSKYYDVDIYFKDKKVSIIGFLDTGNNLVDPYKKQPIVIVYEGIISKYKNNKLLLINYRKINSSI